MEKKRFHGFRFKAEAGQEGHDQGHEKADQEADERIQVAGGAEQDGRPVPGREKKDYRQTEMECFHRFWFKAEVVQERHDQGHEELDKKADQRRKGFKVEAMHYEGFASL